MSHPLPLPPPLVIHTDWSRSWGGQEIRTLTELQEMRTLGYRVGLIVPAGAELAKRAAAEGIPVYLVNAFAKLNPVSWLRLFLLLWRLRPTVINTHSSEDSWMAGAIGRLIGTRLIVRTRHVQAKISSAFSYNAFPHLIFTCSAAIAEQMADQGVAKEKLVTLATGIDEQRFCFAPEHRNRIRREYGIAEDEILVGNVGFLRNYKGQDFILKTAAAMPAGYRFMLVGGGGEWESLHELCQTLGIGDRVIFTGHQEQPEHFLSAFDLCFFPSHETEGTSQALIQSLLNGLPVLACRIASSMEPLSHIEAYRLFTYGDISAACQGLIELAGLENRDPERMERQHRVIAERYGLRAMMRTLLHAYRSHGVFLDQNSRSD